MHFLLKSLSPLQSGTEQSPVIIINVTRMCVRLNLNSVCVYVLYACTYVHIQKAIYIQYIKRLCH